MMETVFPYPGGKSYMASWIIENFPDHDCYAEPFGGGASVLVNKQPSRVEVYNDQDGDVVHFFRVLRENPDELVEWLRQRPYAKDLHEKYGRQFHAGYRPDDDIERAGRFFYIRQSAFSGKYRTHSGFSTSNSTSKAKTYRYSIDDLERFADRLKQLMIENRDYKEIFDRFDDDETLFYCDPPYIKEGDVLYTHGEFDHAELVEELNRLDGYWCVSYTDLPDGLDYKTVVTRDSRQWMSNAGPKEKDERQERLVMNYNLEAVPMFRDVEQSGLESFGD